MRESGGGVFVEGAIAVHCGSECRASRGPRDLTVREKCSMGGVRRIDFKVTCGSFWINLFALSSPYTIFPWGIRWIWCVVFLALWRENDTRY